MVERLLFIGAGVGTGIKKTGASQKRTGSATLPTRNTNLLTLQYARLKVTFFSYLCYN